MRVALSLQTHLFSPREPIFTPDDVACKLHVLERGLIAIRGRILHRGDCFGHEVFYRPGVRHKFHQPPLARLTTILPARLFELLLARSSNPRLTRPLPLLASPLTSQLSRFLDACKHVLPAGRSGDHPISLVTLLMDISRAQLSVTVLVAAPGQGIHALAVTFR